MKQENSNINSEEFDYQDFKIDEKDFRMWVFDRHNPEDSAIFEPVNIPDRNKLIEQIPPEYPQIREFIANSPVDELAAEITEKRKQHRKELEQEYIKERCANKKKSETDSFDVKSENLRKALTQTYENTDAKISFSSRDYSQIKKEKTNRQKQTVNNTDGATDDNKINSQLKKYKTANICLIALIFALLIFFIGQRYIERNSIDKLSPLYSQPAPEKTETESTTFANATTEATDIFADTTTEATATFTDATTEVTATSEDATTEVTATSEDATTEVTATSADTTTTVTTNIENTTLYQETTNAPTSESTTLTEKTSLININTANAKELQMLEGIGEVKAARIIEYRETYGNFSSIREILKVSGIGEKTYEKIKDKITVD